MVDNSDTDECKQNKEKVVTRWFYKNDTDLCIARRVCGADADKGYRSV